MEYSIFDTLLSLPLFQGMAKSDFDGLLQKVRFEFTSYEGGETVITSGQRCERFSFLLSGQMESSRTGQNNRYVFHEMLQAPFLIEPYSMFGHDNQFRRSYRTVGKASFLFIDKQYVYSDIGRYNICRMNMLNMLSGRVQQFDRIIWEADAMDLRCRIIHFFKHLADCRRGEKSLQIKMNDLAAIVDATRINVSRVLNAMQQQGLLQLSRAGIRIPHLENLQEDEQ